MKKYFKGDIVIMDLGWLSYELDNTFKVNLDNYLSINAKKDYLCEIKNLDNKKLLGKCYFELTDTIGVFLKDDLIKINPNIKDFLNTQYLCAIEIFNFDGIVKCSKNNEGIIEIKGIGNINFSSI